MMDELWKTFSLSYDAEGDTATSSSQQANGQRSTTTTTTSTTRSPTPVPSQAHMSMPTSPNANNSTTVSTRPTKAAVMGALEISRQRRHFRAAMASSTSPTSPLSETSIGSDTSASRRSREGFTESELIAQMLRPPDLETNRHSAIHHTTTTTSTSTTAAGRGTIMPPQESRNDQERPPHSSIAHRSLIHIGHHPAGELEVSIALNNHNNDYNVLHTSTPERTGNRFSFEEKNHGGDSVPLISHSQSMTESIINSPANHAHDQLFKTSTMSSDSLNQRADEIIMAAKLACSQANAALPHRNNAYSDDPKSRKIIQEALDRAGTMVKAAAAETSNTSMKQESISNKRATTTSATATSIHSRSTQEVLEMTKGVMKHSNATLEAQQRQSANSPQQRSPVPSSYYTTSNNSTGPVQSPIGRRDNGTLSPTQCLSPAVSDVGSIEDYETAVERLPSRLEESEKLPRAKILQRIDGIVTSPPISPLGSPTISPRTSMDNQARSNTTEQNSSSYASSGAVGDIMEVKAITEESIKMVGNRLPAVATKTNEQRARMALLDQRQQQTAKQQPEETSYSGFSILNYFWGQEEPAKKEDPEEQQKTTPLRETTSFSSSLRRPVLTDSELPAMATSLVRVMSDPLPPSFAEAVNASNKEAVDPRMPQWIKKQFTAKHPLPQDGSYHLGESRTVIVHEVQRGNWTWCTAWSPDGTQLAVATENHHLAVIDTKSSSVWRVRHDKRIQGPCKNGTTHSIRSIAWGAQFIAIGGTGNAVSILAPTQPYPVLHIIKNTGFVGSLQWLMGTNTLVIGSRLGKALVVKIWARDNHDKSQSNTAPTGLGPGGVPRDIQSTIVHTIDRQKAWVNAVKWSPGGAALAVGDGKGILGVYGYSENQSNDGPPSSLTNLANFKLEDSIMDVEWSADGQWLYAGGEDFSVTVINTTWWEAVHRIKRDRWVQFISASKGGSHVAVGGVSSNVSLLEVEKGWDIALNVSLKGLVPLSASWHPKDQYLVLTGQNNSILAVETTNARYVTGHYLRSVSPILDVEFSPDGRMAAIGNEAGIVTIFRLSGTTFISAYELVLDCKGSLSIQWSLSGAFLYIVSGDKLVVIGHTRTKQQSVTAPPNNSGFFVARVVRDLGTIHAVALHHKNRLIAICGSSTRILDTANNYACVKEYKGTGMTMAASWSPDGNWLATIGKNQNFMIYDTSSTTANNWQVVFTVKTDFAGLALTWGPGNVSGLQYCAYGGEGKRIHIMEIRTKERTWENVLTIPRDGIIHQLGWNLSTGLLAAAIGNGTVTIMDLSYLQSGFAVNEMNYSWQRQALTCFTEIRRNRGKNCMRTVRWIPSAPGSDCLLAVGGTDGDVEILDLTERERCSGFCNVGSSI